MVVLWSYSRQCAVALVTCMLWAQNLILHRDFFYYYFNTQPKLCHGDVRGTVTDLKVDFCPINKKCLFKKYFTITFHSISHGINFK